MPILANIGICPRDLSVRLLNYQVISDYQAQAMPYTVRLISNQGEPKTAEISLFGTIGSWAANLDKLKADLNAAGEYDQILILINSYGGYFYDGLAIYNVLKSFKKPITTRVVGYCLSMASHIMLAGSRLECCENGLIMIHRAQGFGSYGDADVLRKEADILQAHDNAIIPAYAARLNISPDEVMALLKAETWYSAQQALDAGLIDAIVNIAAQPVPDETAPDNIDVVNSFKNAPAEFIPTIQRINRKSKPLLNRLLNAVVGEPAPVITPPANFILDTNHMTPEQLSDLKETIKASMSAGFSSLLVPAPTNNADEITALKEQLAAAQNELTTVKAQLVELSTPAPNTPAIPANTGGAISYDC